MRASRRLSSATSTYIISPDWRSLTYEVAHSVMTLIRRASHTRTEHGHQVFDTLPSMSISIGDQALNAALLVVKLLSFFTITIELIADVRHESLDSVRFLSLFFAASNVKFWKEHFAPTVLKCNGTGDHLH